MLTTSLTQKVIALLASCPKTGGGVHRWLFVTSLKLHEHVPDNEELARLLTDATENCGREVPVREIEEAIRDSQRCGETPAAAGRVDPCWPRRNEEQIRSIRRGGPSLAELEQVSPVQRADLVARTEEIIDALFPGNPLLCAGPKKNRALTRAREEWRGFLERQQFIVPSPMATPFGQTRDGHRSMRCLGNTGPRRFLVVEFDQGTFNEHAALLNHLRRFAPLVLAVHSGNKSLHGWFYCVGQEQAKVERFFKYAVSLGADPATWSPCQFVRMPDGMRENGKRQRVIFYNPESIKAI